LTTDYRPSDPGLLVPDGRAAQVARLAVLVPLYGAHRVAEVFALDARLRREWAGRVAALDERGWPPARHGADFLRHCRSAFLMPERNPPPRSCRRAAVCPHCWARRTQEVYRRLAAAAFPEDGAPARYGVWRRELRVPPGSCAFAVQLRPLRVGGSPRLVASLPSILDARLRTTPKYGRPGDLAAARAAGLAGGYEHLRVGIVEDEDGSALRWDVRVRQVLLAEPDWDGRSAAARRFLRPEGLGGLARPQEGRGRRALVEAVGWLMRYPPSLRGEPERVLEILEARARRRLAAAFGVVREGGGGDA
jgi:hypothetical protein